MTLNQGLVGHWTMDDRDTSSGVLYDRSAYDNHGTLEGNPTTGESGQIGDAYSFDEDGNVSIAHSPELSTPEGLTASIWVKSDGTSSTDSFPTVIQKGGNSEWQFHSDDTDTTRVTFNLDIDGSLNQISDDNGLVVGEWTHVILRHTGTDGEQSIYIDGVETESTSYTGTPGTTTSDVDIGVNEIGASVDDVRIYDRALSDSEINQLYQMRSPRVRTDDLSKGLVGHWTMDDADTEGTDVKDSSAYKRTGTITGDPTSASSPIGEGLDFDGTDDYVTLSNIGFSSHTMSCWFNTDVLSYGDGGSNYVIMGFYSAGNSKYTAITMNGSDLNYRIDNGDNSYTLVASDSSINTDQWYHALITYDGDTGDAELYVDGESLGGINYSSGIIFDSDVYYLSYAQGRVFDGTISDARIYDRVLSDAEINRLYNKRV